MKATEGHATHVLCMVCMNAETIHEPRTKTYRLVPCRKNKATEHWHYDATSPASIYVCSDCKVEGEPNK